MYIVWTQYHAYGDEAFHYFAHIDSAYQVADSHANFPYSMYIGWTKQVAYSIPILYYTAHSAWAQQVAYSYVDFPYSIHIVWAQDVAYIYAACRHTTHSVWALKVACSHQIIGIQYTSCGLMKLLPAIHIFTIANIPISSLQPLIKVKLCSLQHALCERKMLITAIQFSL